LNIMNKKSRVLVFALIVLAIALSGCTTAGTTTSWPGIKVADNLAYVAYGNYLYAVKSDDASLAWQFPPTSDKSQLFFSAPEVENGKLVIGSYTNVLYCLDSQKGADSNNNPLWVFKDAKDKYIGSPLLKNGITYAPNADGHLYAVDSNGKLLWLFKTEKANWSKPVTDGTNLYFTSMDHNIYALKLNYTSDELGADETGKRDAVQKPLWKKDLQTAGFADPIISPQGVLYVGTLGGKVFAINSQSGEIIWSYPKGDTSIEGIWSSPVLVGDTIFVGEETGKIYGLSASSGMELWSQPYVAGDKIIGGGVQYKDGAAFVATNGKFVVLNTKGQVSWSKDFTEDLYATPQYNNGRFVLAAQGNDYLLAFFDQNAQYPSFNPPK
jgi:outer membrane protein assembly factor BamB